METRDTILIIDDEPDFVEAFRRTMEARSYRVVTASTRSQAEELVRVAPDLIVLGTMSPAGQAYSLHQWLKQHPSFRDIPLMVIDARESERPERGWRRFEGMQLDSDDYLTKPVEPSMLMPRVQALLQQIGQMIRVLVADDHTMIRDGIAAVLGLHRDIQVVGEAVNGQDAVEKALRLMPNVTLMDIVMPVMSGLEATKRIAKECPDNHILILTQYDEQENMMVAKHNGACGFIPKRAAGAELVKGIRAVYAGQPFPEAFATLGA